MAVERLAPTNQPREIRREDFGSGRAGTGSYQAVLNGFPCQLYIDEDKNKCELPPIGTVDVDIRGDLDFFTYCSPEHADRLENDLVMEIEANGSFTFPGRNGFGRA